MRTMLNALGARRAALQNDKDGQKGFTLIELLVVVIIIGILAAIAIPVYLGIQDNAKNSAVQADLTNAKTAVVAAQTSANGVLPADQAALVASGYKIPAAANYKSTGLLTYSMKSDGKGFCIGATSTADVAWVIDQDSIARKGTCAAGVATFS